MIFYPINLKEKFRFFGSMIRDVLNKSDVRTKSIFWTWKEH